MKDFLDYLQKNKYVFICVSLVVILYALGVIQFLTKFIILLFLIVGAIFLGKTIQDNEKIVKGAFKKGNFKKEDVYYYQETKSKKK